jgi:L-ascorbate metabolism protein UlaG (beta-lactamase superfamily)
MDENVYLKANFVAEPLVDRWYAWAHLISPATAAMNIKNRHIPIMRSYIMAPQAHAAAVKNPKMLGGPFIDYGGKRVEEIRALLEETSSNNAEVIGFAGALEELDTMLRSEAKGYSLFPLYEKVPESLKGYVELVYDLNDNPSYRIKEPLLYHSRFYNEDLQSIQMYLIDNDDRPFVFSTPRLDEPYKITLNIPFRSEAIDELYKMKTIPGSFHRIKELLGVDASAEKLFRSFFTTEAPRPYDRYEGEYIRTRYFGHACILIETRDISILIDPVISYEYEAEVERLTYRDLPDTIDYVLITHNHQDHILLETMLQLRHKVKNVIVPASGGGALQDPSLKLLLSRTGFKNIITLEDLDEVVIPGGRIVALPFFGEHGDLDIRSKAGYLINISEYKVLALADSNNIEPALYDRLHGLYGDVDVLFLGMECDGAPYSWVYGPYVTGKVDREKDQNRRLAGSNYQAGIEIVNRFRPAEVYVYAMGQEPWIKYITSVVYTDESNPIVQSDKLINECRLRGLTAERLFGTKELMARGKVPA